MTKIEIEIGIGRVRQGDIVHIVAADFAFLLVGGGGALLPWPGNRLRDLSKLAAGLRERLPTPVLPSGGQKLPRTGRKGEQVERKERRVKTLLKN